MIIDETGPWTAAAYRVGDDPDTAVQHGVDGGASLCGLPADAIEIYRNPFDGREQGDCRACADRLAAMGAGRAPGS